MHVQLNQYTWLQLPFETRQVLIEAFSIPMSGVRKVEYAAKPIVISDGHTYEDLSVVTIERMQAYTNSQETEFYSLFNRVLAKIDETTAITKKETEDAAAESALQDDETARLKAVDTLVKVSEMATEVLKPKKKMGRPAKNQTI